MDLLELGIAAARAGNKAEARMYLEAVTMAEPDNAQAFLWLSFVLEDRKLALRCLERVLAIDPDNEQAKRGAAWLRSQKDAKAAPLPPLLSDAESTQLVQLLKHPQEPVVVKAIRYLGQAGGARAVEPLLSLLMSTKRKTLQAEARVALIAIGTPSVDPVWQRLLSESNLDLAGQLAAILARIRSMAALAACRDVMDRAQHPSTRYAMVFNLTTSVHGEPALSIVRDYLFDSSQDLRARTAIVAALGQAVKGKLIDARQGIDFLIGIHTELAWPVAMRQAALIAIGISSQPSVLRYLFESMGDKDPQMRAVAVDALARFTPTQTAALDKLAHSPDAVVRKRANQILDVLQAAQKK
jgi:HEAT repeat protein